MIADPFAGSRYLIRKQFFKLFGGAFRIYDESGSLALFADMKAFKLREDIRLYPDENKLQEVLLISARNIIDFSASYDVFDPVHQEKVGMLRRRGFKSMIKDEWVIFDAAEREVGTIKEDNIILALLRRFATNLIPQRFHGYIGDDQVFQFQQHFNPIVAKINLDFSSDTNSLLDRRLGLAAAVLLCAIEGRQQ